MASKKKPANFKVTKSKNEIMTAVLISLVTTLIVIVIGVILLHANQTSDKTSQTAEKVDNGSVSLGLWASELKEVKRLFATIQPRKSFAIF